MDKVKLEFKTPKNKIVEYNGVEFEVTPLLGLTQQIIIINKYLEAYFENRTDDKATPMSKYNYIEAEYTLANYIIQLTTNIDVTDATYELMLDTRLLDTITSEIYNYKELRSRLDYIINEIKEQKNLDKSVGAILDSAVSDIKDLISNFSDINITPEQLEEVKNVGENMIKELQQSAILPLNTVDEPIVKKAGRKKKSSV